MDQDDRQPEHGLSEEHTPNGDAVQGGAAPAEALDQDEAKDQLIVAGIGASAGGTEALQAFFEALAPDLGIAYVVVTHLSPEHRSHLPEILGSKTAMPVTQVHETVPLEADHVYLIPPGRRLAVTDGHISALPFEEPHGHRAPIDLFFRSFAEAHGDGFAILFSGGGSDGSVGLKAVKEVGGLVLVQDPSEAKHDSMPRNAIATGLADLVLPVRELAAQMPDLVRSKRRVHLLPKQLDGDTQTDGDTKALRDIFALLHTRTGHDFSQYKRSTVLRRIGRRMQVHRLEQLGDYRALLRTDSEEPQALFQDLLISVTTFFRDSAAFEALAERVIPSLFDDRGENDPIRVWVPGCATGEEAYSLAILLLEEAERRGVFPTLQIFATDLDEDALTTARNGRYPDAIEADVSPERLARFFERDGDHYRARPEIRDFVLFATHSLLRDPPFSRLDLASCRNLLIYLDLDLQRHVFDILHYALRPGGYLFLGSSETADDGLFRPVGKDHRIFQALAHPTGEHPPLPNLLSAPRARLPEKGHAAPPEPMSEGTLHRKTLEDVGPPSALVDERYRVVHLSETAGRFLQPPGGTLTSDLAALVRPELQFELRAALHRAFHDGVPTFSPAVPVRFNGTAQRVHLVVRPRPPRKNAEPLALVVFIEGNPVEDAPLAAGDQAVDETVRQLSEELRQARGQLQTTREEADTSTEELRASNEELQSINEEYRSTTEQLETSKEELHSINEEIETVNAELNSKLGEVRRAHDDLENLMVATEVGTLFLDPDLIIKRFTPPIADLFNIAESDHGRPITDLTHHLEYPAFVDDVRAVLGDLAPIEREVHSTDGRWFLARLHPYRTVDNRVHGVVATFVDFTARKQAEEALRQSEERYRLLFESVEEYAIFTLELDGRIASWNTGAEQIFRYTEDEIVGQPVDLIFTEEDRAAGVPEQEMETAARTGTTSDERWHVRRDGSRFWASGVMTALREPGGSLRGFAKVLRDNTERKEAEAALRRAKETLEERVLERTEQVRELASTLAVAEQDERRRIAQILHDDLQQLLFAIQLKMTFVQRGADAAAAPDLAAYAEESEGLLQQAIQVSRRLTVDLSPPVLAGEGLADALEWLKTPMLEVHGLTVDIRSERPFVIPQEGMRVLLFQVVRELLFNVVKHAGTDHATVTLAEHDGDLSITVEDGGDGFDPEAIKPDPDGGFGLFSVRERLRLFEGQLEIVSVPGDGTRVTATLPALFPVDE